ncbi:MAG TPA: ribosome biogenesis GTP-binding protein YihA/YsxC [Campylobacterales bacterium]|nr:ribosome biogenesis GTP-binding protein YihA/YsxC [Campylobacterales bacterium]
MRILNAEFVKSAAKLGDSPSEDFAEVAFLGRSNVGKSSLINAFCSRKDLAKSSSTPGKTKLINFFDINAAEGEERLRFRLVDLPGFGYAKVSKGEKELWEENLTRFLFGRSAIKLFLLLRDSRHPKMEIDDDVKEFLSTLNRRDYTVCEVFTKVDKLTKNELSLLRKNNPNALFVSASAKIGLDMLLAKSHEALFGKIA